MFVSLGCFCLFVFDVYTYVQYPLLLLLLLAVEVVGGSNKQERLTVSPGRYV
jgi:hypothetical protein